jgi:hypothetical protein
VAASARRRVVLGQEREDAVRDLVDVGLRIDVLGVLHAVEELGRLELRPEQHPVDLVVAAPLRRVDGANLGEQATHVCAPRFDGVGTIVRETVVPRVQSLAARPDGIAHLDGIVVRRGDSPQIRRRGDEVASARRLSRGDQGHNAQWRDQQHRQLRGREKTSRRSQTRNSAVDH